MSRVRTEAEKERRNYVNRLKRAAARGERQAEWAAFLARQAAQVVIAPSQAEQQKAKRAEAGETVAEFMARGGSVEQIPGFEFKPHAAGLPMRAAVYGNRAL
jgi:hypothetical protein